MTYKVVPIEKKSKLLKDVVSGLKIIAPVRKRNQFAFQEVETLGEISCEFLPTILPPTKYFFPQKDALIRFLVDGKAERVPISQEPFAVVGMRPCDCTGLWLLDEIFAEGIAEGRYQERRKLGSVIAFDCAEPCDDFAFCHTVDSLEARGGYDLLLTDARELTFVAVGSEKGKVLLAKTPLARDATREEVKKIQAFRRDRKARFPYKFKIELEKLPDLFASSRTNPYWKELGEIDLGCGSCNLVCPTCYCFDVFDELELNLKEGRRLRQWDGCTLQDFARVASGENFRESRGERLFHRFNRKFNYLMEKYNQSNCVGCGRCARACLVDINPVNVVNRLAETTKIERRARPELPIVVPERVLGTDYVPMTGRIVRVEQMTELEKFFEIELEGRTPLGHVPGQFVQVSIAGVGEAPISVSSSPNGKSTFELCVRKMGNVTSALHRLTEGNLLGIRGPFGRGFDIETMKGKDIVFIAGGIGLVPMRSLIQAVLEDRKSFGRLTILSGVRKPSEFLFREETAGWGSRENVDVRVTVDRPHPEWNGHVGLITTLIPDVKMDPANTICVIIGPPVMYQFVVLALMDKKIPHSSMVLSLERRMKCGMGKCGHCQIGSVYVCQCGPVFTYEEIRKMEGAI